MQELRGNLFIPTTYAEIHEGGLVTPPIFDEPDAICITVNGFIKSNGRAVMGRGCAQRACQLYSGLDSIWGNLIKNHGNRVQWHATNNINIVFFPVKPKSDLCNADKSNVVRHMQKQFKPGDRVPGWACIADHDLIKKSAHELVQLTDEQGWEVVILPRPGCGAGELDWGTVRANLSQYLDDRFYTITF